MFVPATNEPLNIPVSSNVLITEPLTISVPSNVLITEPLTTLVPSKFLNTLPLTISVPSNVLITEPLTILLPSVIWDEPLIVPLGKEPITCAEPLIVPAGTEPPPPLGNVIVLPVDIVNWSPSIESVWESVSDVK